ncbi:MAG: UDP-N-acetylmuramate dehydrogenase [Parvibaculales bacterium]
MVKQADFANLAEHLPDLRGKLRANVSLSDLTWFRVGGAAAYLFTPADKDDLAYFLQNCPEEVPLYVLGAGSNSLVRDGGFAGVVIKLGKAFAEITVNDQNQLTAGAAALDKQVALFAAKNGLAGLAFYVGIPGSIGGALRMNAGAYGGETADCFVQAVALDQEGREHVFTKQDMEFAYRHCGVPEAYIFISATYQLQAGARDEIEQQMQDIVTSREDSQPIRARTGGSTFRNPGGTNPDGPKAWKLIDAAGCRGMRLGDAQISEKHCNFLINHGAAAARDLEALGEQVRQRVQETAGIELHWEIKRIGQAQKAAHESEGVS